MIATETATAPKSVIILNDAERQPCGSLDPRHGLSSPRLQLQHRKTRRASGAPVLPRSLVRRILIARRVVPRAGSSSLRISPVERLSLVDWPGQLAAVVFCQGCGWRCRYCHNPHLIPFPPSDKFAWEDITGAGWKIVAACSMPSFFSGGEPTLHPGLYVAMEEARALGFKIGLHTVEPGATAGMSPLLSLLDWVGFDFKAPFSGYARLTGHSHGEQARASFEMLRSARVPCEVRTTWHPSLLSTDDLAGMARSLAEAGYTEWIIQRFRPDGCNDEELHAAPVGAVPVEAIHVPGLNIVSANLPRRFFYTRPGSTPTVKRFNCSLFSLPRHRRSSSGIFPDPY